MFGWKAIYVRKTQEKIASTPIKNTIKLHAPKDSEVPFEPFLPYIETQEPQEPLKSRHKRKVFYCAVGGEGFYLKKYSYRFTSRHYAHLRGFVWSIPIALRQMQKMLFLRECGAGVAEPVMCFTRRYAGIKQESLLVMRECPGTLLKLFLKQEDDFQRRLQIIAQTFDFLRISHSMRIHHGDLATHNFIVTPRNRLRAIDLDERKTKWLGPLGNRKELKKWVGRSMKLLDIEKNAPAIGNKREAFATMLKNNYPEALRYFHDSHICRAEK